MSPFNQEKEALHLANMDKLQYKNSLPGGREGMVTGAERASDFLLQHYQ